MLNVYGPTEATIWATAHLLAPSDAEVCIGGPLPNLVCAIVDAHLSPVSTGVVGELCIGGVGVARGYLRRPELTARAFVRRADGARLYRTGDLARWTPERSIVCLGRADSQVKLRGHRIELVP